MPRVFVRVVIQDLTYEHVDGLPRFVGESQATEDELFESLELVVHDDVQQMVLRCVPAPEGHALPDRAGRLDIDGRPMSHIFDGDGMVSRIGIGPDDIHYRNRYVRTKSFAEANETRRPPKGFGTQRLGGPLSNAMRFPENLVDTSVLLHDDALCAPVRTGQ